MAPEGYEESAPEPPSPLTSSPFPSPIATEVKERLQNYFNKLKYKFKDYLFKSLVPEEFPPGSLLESRIIS